MFCSLFCVIEVSNLCLGQFKYGFLLFLLHCECFVFRLDDTDFQLLHISSIRRFVSISIRYYFIITLTSV